MSERETKEDMKDYVNVTLATGWIMTRADERPSDTPEERLCDLPDTIMFGVRDFQRIYPKAKGFTLNRRGVVTWTNLQI